MFIWTGFDYRGEPTPFGFPSIGSYFGMMDQCGFPKDNVYYLRSWWSDKAILHILPHWNHPGKEGQEIDVWVYSNCDEVELFLNRKSHGKKPMQKNGHLEWKVKYQPGTLEAIGFKNGKKLMMEKVQTTTAATAIRLSANKNFINADKEDIAMITVDALDKNNLAVPDADCEITFSIKGPGKIIGVGNGNPASLEADKYLEAIKVVAVENLKEKVIENLSAATEIAENYNDKDWQTAFKDDRTAAFGEKVKALVYRGVFILPEIKAGDTVTFFYNSIGSEQSVFINGKAIAANISQSQKGNIFILDASILHKGINSISIVAAPLLKKQPWETVNTNPGLFQIVTPAQAYKRKLFSGLAQVIVQSTGEPGKIIVTGTANDVKQTEIIIESKQAIMRASVTGN